MARKITQTNWRLNLIILCLFLVSCIIVWRLFNFQILNHDFYKAQVIDQHAVKAEAPARGSIFFSPQDDKSLYALAINKDWPMVYAVPSLIKDPEKTSDELSSLLNMDRELIFSRLSKREDPWEPLKNRLDQSTVELIKALNINGIEIGKEKLRYYPEAEITAHISGFLGFKNEKTKGQYGLESFYNKELEKGLDLVLTIDHTVQFLAFKKLEELMGKYKAERGSIIIMESKTGAILAMVNLPAFDPNEYFKVKNINLFLNKSISYRYEPGSVFKAITMAGALEERKVEPEEKYEDKGVLIIDRYLIDNAGNKVYGWQTMTEVLEKSLNTGAVFIQQKLGKELFYKYLKKFGLNQKIGIDLTGEINNDISNLDYKKSDINYATASFGQGVAVTPIAFLSAFNTIANDGNLMQPFLVSKILKGSRVIQKKEPRILRNVISAQTAFKLTGILVSVVDNGFVSAAKVPGFLVTGKTGTAQIPEAGTYSKEVIHTFVGFAPAFDAKFSILIKLDKPKNVRFASESVASAFSDLAKSLLNYYKIQPDR